MSHLNLTVKEILIFVACIIFVLGMVGYADYRQYVRELPPPPVETVTLYPYQGKIYHIFFHSLIVYPEIAFKNSSQAQGYRDYMVTKDEFNIILSKLYENNFILIDPHLIYEVKADGTVASTTLQLPYGKKPLILSLDDINYYDSQYHEGLANRLVFDVNGEVATEITTPENKTIVTRDGDIIPILDDFIKLHPDFSLNGVKGIIAETGFEGVLGYRTNNINSETYISDVVQVKKLVEKLKSTGWIFASHSYSHKFPFRDASISFEAVKLDTDRWEKEVKPLVGETNIFIGPFGQVFKLNDPRRDYILSKGFKILFGVGMDLYLKYEKDHVIMNRANIDGIRLIQTPYLLEEYFDPKDVMGE